MSKDQAKADPGTTTADGTSHNEAAPASEHVNQQPTTTDKSTTSAAAPVRDAKVVAVDDYESQLAAALEVSEESAQEESAAGETTQEAATEEATSEEESTQAEETQAGNEQQVAKDKGEFRPRLSKLDERAQEAILLVKQLADAGEKISLGEAERRVNAKYGDTQTEESAEKAKTADNEATIRTPEQIREEIKAQKDARRTAIKDLDPDKQLEAEDQIDALESELQKTEAQYQAKAQTEEERFYEEVETARARMLDVYPVAKDEAHAIHAKAAEIFKAMEETGNPLVFDSQAPLKVYQMAANELGIAPGRTTATAKKSPTPATSATRPRAVEQSAVVKTTAFSPASGAARTNQTGTIPGIDIAKVRTAADYESLVESIGAPLA